MTPSFSYWIYWLSWLLWAKIKPYQQVLAIPINMMPWYVYNPWEMHILYMYIYIYVYIYIYMYVFICIYIYTYVCIHMYIYIFFHVLKHIFMYTYIHVYYLYIYVCICVYNCIYTYGSYLQQTTPTADDPSLLLFGLQLLRRRIGLRRGLEAA